MNTLFSKVILGFILTLIIVSCASADVLMLFADTNFKNKQYSDQPMGFGNYFCVKNENGGSYIVTAEHVVSMETAIEEEYGLKLQNVQYYVLLYNKDDHKYYRTTVDIIAKDHKNDIAVVYVKGQTFKVDQLVSDKAYSIGTKVCINYDYFGMCNNIVVTGNMISNEAMYNDRVVRLLDVDVVHGSSGSAVRLNNENGAVIGVVTNVYDNNGITIMTPSSVVIDFLKNNKIL